MEKLNSQNAGKLTRHYCVKKKDLQLLHDIYYHITSLPLLALLFSRDAEGLG